MIRSLIRAAAVLGLVGTAVLLAEAQDWSRTGPSGSVARSYDADGGYTVDRSGSAGGSTSATVDCARGGGLNCSRDYTVTNPQGETVSGTRQSRFGPLRGRSVNSVTGPDGASGTLARPSWRYNAADPGFRGRRPDRW